jgi:hypothetical protein
VHQVSEYLDIRMDERSRKIKRKRNRGVVIPSPSFTLLLSVDCSLSSVSKS